MDTENLNSERVSVASTSLVRLLWRCGYVKPSAKPVKVIELGDGQIKVVGSCQIHQPIDQPNESYHESYEDALRRFVANGERDLKRAETELAGAKRKLASRKAMWTKHCELCRTLSPSGRAGAVTAEMLREMEAHTPFDLIDDPPKRWQWRAEYLNASLQNPGEVCTCCNVATEARE